MTSGTSLDRTWDVYLDEVGTNAACNSVEVVDWPKTEVCGCCGTSILEETPMVEIPVAEPVAVVVLSDSSGFRSAVATSL